MLLLLNYRLCIRVRPRLVLYLYISTGYISTSASVFTVTATATSDKILLEKYRGYCFDPEEIRQGLGDLLV